MHIINNNIKTSQMAPIKGYNINHITKVADIIAVNITITIKNIKQPIKLIFFIIF